MKASSRLKIISAICALAAAGLIGYALWLVVPQLVLMSRTKQIAAEVVNKDDPTGKYRRMRQGPALLPQIIRAHDESGYAIYGLKFTFVYFLNGQKYIADTETPYRTRDVAGILELRNDYEEGNSRPIRYDPNKPEQIYFESGMPARLWQPALWSFLGALVLMLFGVILFRLSRPHKICPACGIVELENYYKFCPGCSATVSKK